MNVAVLGCGPAGLLAAAAALNKGANVKIYSEKQKSKIHGAQYLHDPIPGYTSRQPDGVLNYVKWGNKEGYAEKVYGSPKAPCSWQTFKRGELPAWSLSDLYYQLWEDYESYVVDGKIGATDIDRISRQHDLVISTIPAINLCEARGSRASHIFYGQSIYIDPNPQLLTPSNTIIYSGKKEDDWYRTSEIFGYGSTEYSGVSPNPENYFTGVKPTHTNCKCRPEIIRAGRFGQWKKGVLVHHAYQETINALQ